MTNLQKTFIAAIVVAGVATSLVVQHQSQVKLRDESQSLRHQVDELSNRLAQAESSEASKPSLNAGLAAPRIEVTAPTAESSPHALQSNNVMALLLRGDAFPPKVRTEQIEAYLKENGRSAASLLASSRVTGDQTLLQEAMEKYPHDPQVSFAALFKKDASPEERRQSLEAFKQSAPDNALASYLSAREFFKSGQLDQAVQELNAAYGKGQFQDYFMDFSQNEEEAWGAAGYSTAEAKVFSSWSLLHPHFWELQQLGRDNMVSLASSYRESGDEASAQTALQMAVALSQRFDGLPGQPWSSRDVQLVIASSALRAMDPTNPYGGSGQTVSDRLNEVEQQRDALNHLMAQGEKFELRQKVSDQDWITYKDRCRAFGEETALRWLVGKYVQK